MSQDEKILLALLELVSDRNRKAVLLQFFIQENGPLSEEAAAAVRSLLR